MATTIRSTELDFDEIKNNLKAALARTPEFKDYNFEASGLSSLLDVLAYNTHYNSLLANFALNESFLSTAQLRSSLVSLAGSLGYTVRGKNASCAIVNLYVTNALNPATMTLPAGFKFSTTVNNKSYTFRTRQALVATNNGANQYYFKNGENLNVVLYEGVQTRNTFIAGPSGENQSYIIPTENLDLNTVEVRVYADPSTSFYDVYTNINDAVSLTKDSQIYVLKEAPNGQYELTFGNGARLGRFPTTGNKIEIIYDQVAGADANGARTFTPTDIVLDDNGDELTLNVVTQALSTAGASKEGIESIRKNAPYLYSSQNRMVTAQDYRALTLRKYSNVIKDIKTWGGEDQVPPKYGSVYMSIVFNTADAAIQSQTKTGIEALTESLSVASFNIEFEDPINIFLETAVTFQWNPNLTSEAQTAIQTKVNNTINDYFNDQLGGFDKSFRRSNMLTRIDDTDPSILSSRADVLMQYRFTPSVGVVTYDIVFPTSIATPNDTLYIVRSETFNVATDEGNKVCFFRNRLGSNRIELIDLSTGLPIQDNIGSYNAATGVITLSSFTGTLISGAFIRVRAKPANEATINAQRNSILSFDEASSSAVAVITDTV